jgi:histidyl-tRNA synthetase
MGDAVLEILLQERGLLEKQVPKRRIEYFVALADPGLAPQMYRVTAQIRSSGHSANFSYKPGGLSKQLKEAAGQNAPKCVIIGQEYSEKKQLAIKDMATGGQESVDAEQFLASLTRV